MEGVWTFGTEYQFPVILMVDQAFPCDTNVVSWRLRIGQQNQAGDGYLTVWRPMEGGQSYKLIHQTHISVPGGERYYHKNIVLETPLPVKQCDVIGFKQSNSPNVVMLQGTLAKWSAYINDPTAYDMFDVKYLEDVDTTALGVGSVV